jgi:hypothetical protein
MVACADFSFAVPMLAGVAALYSNSARLKRMGAGQPDLAKGCWSPAGSQARVCVRLHEEIALSWRREP